MHEDPLTGTITMAQIQKNVENRPLRKRSITLSHEEERANKKLKWLAIAFARMKFRLGIEQAATRHYDKLLKFLYRGRYRRQVVTGMPGIERSWFVD